MVCGGGFAGISAALAAARQGKNVTLLEKEYILGGLGTAGLITIYLPLCDGMGKQVSFGIAEELFRLSVSMGAEKDYPALKEVALRFGVFQRLEYLLHIPISQMTGENEQYQNIVKWLRRNWLKAMCNAVLTPKNKVYHTLFSIAPRKLREIHRMMGRAGK